MDATFNLIDVSLLPSANCALKLQDAREELKAATGIEINHLDTSSIQERVGKPFNRLIKDNISSWFGSSSKDVYHTSVILIQRKYPASQLISYLYMETVQFKF